MWKVENTWTSTLMSSREYELDLSSEAERDIEGILTYTAKKWGRQQVPIYKDTLDTALQTILRHPGIGHTSSILPIGYRSRPAGSHIVYYRVLENTVRVDRILHERMDPAKHLQQV
jgi:toxin ParE1/3/4